MDPKQMMSMGTGLSAGGQLAGGIQANRSAKFSAQQAERNALAELAAGVSEATEQRRQGRAVQSDARAAMAAGGGTTTDPGAIETLGKIGQVSEYNALSALFGGQNRAEALRTAARARRAEGRSAMMGGLIGGGATALSGKY
jgi:hypothetical protein